MTNSSSTVNSFFDRERLRQAAALAGPNAGSVAVVHTAGFVSQGAILRKLRDDKAVGIAEIWIHGDHFGTYRGYPNAIWNQSSQPPAPSVADSLAGMAERIDQSDMAERINGPEVVIINTTSHVTALRIHRDLLPVQEIIREAEIWVTCPATGPEGKRLFSYKQPD